MKENEYAILRKQGEALQPDLVAYRRKFHSHPELKMETPWTESQIIEALKDIGIENITSGIGGHGVSALVHGLFPGKCLGIRADCDGLPIPEETRLPFASKNGNMHACGHDSHIAMALGAAKLLMENRDKLKGTVKFIFQPYEEGDRGASMMIDGGVLQDPQVDAIISMHNGCNLDSSFTSGDILVTPHPTSANIFAYKATFHGTGSHVCWSHESINPIYIAAESTLKIRDLLPKGSRSINAVTIINGGVRNNVIPETCSIDGSIRSFDREEHQCLRNGVVKIIEETAKTYGGSVDFTVNIDLMSTNNNRKMFDHFCKMAESVYPERKWKLLDPVPMIGEDFARYADMIPGFYFMLCAKPAGAKFAHHSPKFMLDESVLSKGSILFAAFALSWQD